MQSRRRFLSTGLPMAGVLGFAGVASLVSERRSFAAEPPPETTTVRLAKMPTICIAPQYVMDDLLREEGFNDVRYVAQSAATSHLAITRGELVFNKGEGGFLDRDLYVFCNNVGDGKSVSIGNPNAKQLLGTDVRPLKDPTGKAFGLELYAAGQKPEGQITEVSYMFVRPGPDTKPVPKVSLVTRVGDIYCGVGYYKQ
jgi:hypothetical protein